MAEELFRNILLAMAVVFLVTLVVIASPMTSFLVFLCVVFTVVSIYVHHIYINVYIYKHANHDYAEKMAAVHFPSNTLRSKIFEKANGYLSKVRPWIVKRNG